MGFRGGTKQLHYAFRRDSKIKIVVFLLCISDRGDSPPESKCDPISERYRGELISVLGVVINGLCRVGDGVGMGRRPRSIHGESLSAWSGEDLEPRTQWKLGTANPSHGVGRLTVVV